jgi:hypothetical protein
MGGFSMGRASYPSRRLPVFSQRRSLGIPPAAPAPAPSHATLIPPRIPPAKSAAVAPSSTPRVKPLFLATQGLSEFYKGMSAKRPS